MSAFGPTHQRSLPTLLTIPEVTTPAEEAGYDILTQVAPSIIEAATTSSPEPATQSSLPEEGSDTDDEFDNSPIVEFIYTNPLGLKSILKKTRLSSFSLEEKKVVSFGEYNEVFHIEAREVDDGPRVYSGADAAAMLLAMGDDEDDEDSDEDEEEWGPGPNASVSSSMATTPNDGPRVYSGPDAAAMIMAMGDDDEDSDSDYGDDEDEEEWGPGLDSIMASISTIMDTTNDTEEGTQTSGTISIEKEIGDGPIEFCLDFTNSSLSKTSTTTSNTTKPSPSHQNHNAQTQADLRKITLYINAMTSPADLEAVAILLRLDLYAESALKLLKSGFSPRLRPRGTLHQCTWLPFPLGSIERAPSASSSASKYERFYEEERAEEETKEEGGLGLPKIVLTTPGGGEWELMERMEDLEGSGAYGVDGWKEYLEEREGAQERLREKLERRKAMGGVRVAVAKVVKEVSEKVSGTGEEGEGDSGYVSEAE